MDVQSQLLLLGVLPDIYRIMVAERERVRGLVSTPAHPRVSLSRPTATEETGSLHIRLFLRRNNPDVVEKSVRDDRLAMWPAGKE